MRMGEDPGAVVLRDRQAYSETYKSYFRAATWSRLAFIAFWILAVVFVVWAMPWFHVGMSASDYSPQVVIALILLGLCPAVTAVAVLLRSIAKQRREALVAWLSIHDEATGLRTQDYFFERLKLQCELGSQVSEYSVGVVLMSVEEMGRDGRETAPAKKTLHLIGSSIAGEMRPTDLVTVLGEREIGVLVSVASPSALEIVSERVRRSLHGKLEEICGRHGANLMVQLGAASLDATHSDPEALLGAARGAFKIVHLDGKNISAA